MLEAVVVMQATMHFRTVADRVASVDVTYSKAKVHTDERVCSLFAHVYLHLGICNNALLLYNSHSVPVWLH